MKSKKIDSNLLIKYTENSCSEEERILVEEWLSADTFDNISSNASFDNNSSKWKQEIWDSLSSSLNIPKQRYYYSALTNISKYAACAAIFIIVAIGFFQRETLKNTLFDSPNLKSRIVQVCDKPTLIIVEDDSEIVFVSTKKGSEDLCHKMNCERGNTYFAIMVKYKSVDEILVVDKRDIQNLPPHLGMQIANQIKS